MRKQAKQEKKDRVKVEKEGGHKKRVYVLDFEGTSRPLRWSLYEEITSILSIAKKRDEVVLKLSSSGGMVHTYGLASSQVQRICDRDIPLTICVDKVAASGGYMMACIADKIIAAPLLFSARLRVVAQLPNFNRLLKNDVDFELMTAGEYKRTLTLFGENTDKGRENSWKNWKTPTVCSRHLLLRIDLSSILMKWLPEKFGLANAHWLKID